MPHLVAFAGQRQVVLEECPAQPLEPGSARVATLYSGISAGTELTAYRGSNPYLTRTWDATERLFVEGPATFAYPIRGWGYSEVGRVVEVGPEVTRLSVGDLVFGIWGHRSDAVVPAAALRVLPPDADPLLGCFARVGAIALNAVLAADVRLGESTAVFGQGVIGLLATAFAVRSGGRVFAIDGEPARLETALTMGATSVVRAGVSGGAGAWVRRATNGGADSAIELSGRVAALHEAIRSVRVAGVVAASGFYQGGAAELRLGEEFHHNRVRIVASQISGTPVGLGSRWNQARLVDTVMAEFLAGRVDPLPLVTDVVPAAQVGEVFGRLDAGDPAILQAVLSFDGATTSA